MTKRLYEEDAYLRHFEANVLACEADGDDYLILLDRTAFFPEGGGQAADTGTLDGIPVTDTQIVDDLIYHRTHAPLEIGKTVIGVLDFDARYDRMQNHTGEHIVSGLVYATFGIPNVGFHLGSEETTLDFASPLSREELDYIEDRANEAIWRNLPISARYLSEEEKQTVAYRAKKEIPGPLRLVTIPDIDACACCAPHVKSTGEVGLIKLLDFIHYKGGIRVRMLCGRRALADYRQKYATLSAISHACSAPQWECAVAVDRLLTDLNDRKQEIATLRREALDRQISTFTTNGRGHILYFSDFDDDRALSHLALGGAARTNGLCAVFAGEDEGGYRVAIASDTRDLRTLLPRLREALCLRGGGNERLVQGRSTATRTAIEALFSDEI